MKKLFALFLSCLAICSCSNGITEQKKKEMLNYNVTTENYAKFFKVSPYEGMYKVIISPYFNKHLTYENVVFNFRSTYSISTGAGQYQEETYDFSITVDKTGNGQGVRYKGGSASSIRVAILSVTGTASFKEDYTSFQQLNKVKRDLLHKEDIGVYFSLSSASSYTLRFKTDLNFSDSADTDAFYVIGSVKVKFTATVNNASKNFEYDMHPNFCGIAEIPIEENYSNIKDFSFKYTDAYYLVY